MADYYDMMNPMKSQAQDEHATALKSDTGPQTVTTVKPKTQAEGGMGYLHGGATPSPDTKIPEATKIGAEIVAGELSPIVGTAIAAKDAVAAIEAKDPAAAALSVAGAVPFVVLPADLMRKIKAGDKSWATTYKAAKTLKSGDIDLWTWMFDKLNPVTKSTKKKLEKLEETGGHPLDSITDSKDRDLIYNAVADQTDSLLMSLDEGTWIREAAEQFAENPKKKVRVGPSMQDILDNPDIEGISQQSRAELEEILPLIERGNAQDLFDAIFDHLDWFAEYAAKVAEK